MEKITIEIDQEVLKKEMIEHATREAIRRHFGAEDINDYNERQKIKQKRLDDVITKVDWDKLPEMMKNEMAKGFFKKFFGGMYS